MTEADCLPLDAYLAAPGRFVLIDVRGADDYAVAHIPGARHIPLDRLAGEAFTLPSDRCPVTVCGKGGGRSAEGATILRNGGRVEALWLCGGTNGWFAPERR